MAPYSVKLNPLGIALVVAVVGLTFIYLMSGTFHSKEKVSIKELISVSVDLAAKAGVKVKEVRESSKLDAASKGLDKEGKKMLVSEGDNQSNRVLILGFAKAFPRLKVVSEESQETAIDVRQINMPLKTNEEIDQYIKKDKKVDLKDITVWVDPLDATQEYTENLKEYVTVMVCVAVRGEPVAGIIHKPFTQETFWAWAGHGESPNLRKGTSSPGGEGEAKRFIVSRSHAGDVKKVVEEQIGKDATIQPAGGAGYKTLEVIQGRQDVYVHVTRIKKWDICAGDALLRSVGGKMTDLHGLEIDYANGNEEKNEGGLLVTMKGHETILQKMKPVADELEKHNTT